MDLNGKDIAVSITEVKLISTQEEASFPTEGMLKLLKNKGYGKVETIKVLMDVFPVPFHKIKDFVHGSETWDDQRALDDELHDTAEAFSFDSKDT